jgi:uncharacterized membrane protein YdbT with pleckstrin-like domain
MQHAIPHDAVTQGSVHAPGEQEIWSGTPSQWVNFNTYLFLFWTVLIPLYRYFIVKSTKYRITTQRVFTSKGLFSVTEDELELYRVKDSRVERPLLLRLLGLANIVIATSDESTPILRIEGVSNAKQIREELRTAVERERDRKRVREVDYA